MSAPEPGARRLGADVAGQLLLRGGNLALGIVVTVVLVRALGAVGFGQWSTVMAVVMIVLYLGDLGLEQVAVNNAAADPGREVEWVSSLVTLRLAIALPVLALSAVVCAVLADERDMAIAGAVLSLVVLTAGLAASRAVFQLRTRNVVPARLELVNGLLWGIAVLALAGLDAGIVAFAVAFTVTMAITQVATLVLAMRILPLRLRGGRDHWPTLVRAGVPVSVAGMLVLSFGKIDQVLVYEIAGERSAGLYGAAYRILDRAALLPGSILASFFPLIAGAYGARNLARVRELFQTVWDLLAVLSLPVLSFSIVAADALALALFGEEFAEAASVLPILMGVFVLVCFGYLGGYMVVALHAQKRFILVCLAALILNVVANLLLIPGSGYLAAAWITVATELFVLGLTLRLILPRIAHRLALGRTARATLAAGLMGLAVWAVDAVGVPLAGQVVVAALSYPLLAFGIGAVTRADLASMRGGPPEGLPEPLVPSVP